jgi:predicted metal-dependent peptidase
LKGGIAVTTSRPADPIASVERDAARQEAAECGLKAVAAARVRLILGRNAASAFFATLALRLRVEPDASIPTLATDGRVLEFNPSFVIGLTPDELVGCVTHEVMHCALSHFARRAGRDLARWNIACDLAVNPILLEAGFTLPPGRLVPGEDQFGHFPPGKSADDYYRLLDDPTNSTSQLSQQQEAGSDPGGCGGVIDPVDGCSAALAESAPLWRMAVIQAESAARGRGDLPAGFGRVIQDVLYPPADWRAILREFVSSHARNDYAWCRPNRRFLAAGLYLPGLYSVELGDVVVAVDTSGSVGAKELGVFAAEVEALLGAFDCTATLVYHDTQVQKVETWTPSDGPLVLVPVGGGGTSHLCVFEWLDQSDLTPACTICLTDLETRFPDRPPAVPVLWAVVGDARVDPPFGFVVPIGP